MSGQKSEFGRGYATCLRQFANHRTRLEQMTADEADPMSISPVLWANGASDHLIEMKLPVTSLGRVEIDAARRMRDGMVDAGHGRGLMGCRQVTKMEMLAQLDIADRLLEMLADRGHPVGTLEQCMATDRRLRLAPDTGRYACGEDLNLDRGTR